MDISQKDFESTILSFLSAAGDGARDGTKYDRGLCRDTGAFFQFLYAHLRNGIGEAEALRTPARVDVTLAVPCDL
jgi:hypothetical protein